MRERGEGRESKEGGERVMEERTRIKLDQNYFYLYKDEDIHKKNSNWSRIKSKKLS